jgi:hypothetical protein
MKPARILAAVALVVVAVVVALLALDLSNWRNAVRNGDSRFATDPAGASWQISPKLPFKAAETVLGISNQIAYRQLAQSFVAVNASGNGVDNGYSESRTRGALEAELTQLAPSLRPVLESEAENLLGILAFSDSQQNGPEGAAPVSRSVAAFEAAVQIDPRDEQAKYNLELLLHDLAAEGSRSGSNGSSGGPSKGHKGANGGSPGSGY